MTNQEKAVAVLKSLQSGNKKAIEDYVSAEKYIQHNLNFGDGRDGLIGALDYLKQIGTKVEVKRVLSEGDLVAVHSEYELNGPKAIFDIFRFEDGKIVEHWDNIQELVKDTANGHTMLDGETQIEDEDKTAENKAIVENFVKDILMGQNADKFTSYFNGDNYIQHNPYIADGLSGLGKALEEWAKQGITMQYDKLHLIVAQGNFVLVVSEGQLGGKHTSFYDLFRVENGKIAEHWDVVETILPKEEWKNENGKF
ncbi:hypothetical protein AB685_01535 [Bacillus sp. LL01]|uniref:nuclear transport factor 2 family protein n=1 Tax=Bacillus sp. LL01 TaxID=1665556 RepID=UPI00064D1C81|nr:nuclear transport factor 2 family protein [Bacillus sp. LL01]KMJ59585.1 hypothetical protein AB685_01535 [Bacillus sp. LL01]